MLVLTRKYQEKIRIGDNIVITVLRTKGKAVRLGIEAPNNVPVVRGELQFESQAELNEESTSTASDAMTSARANGFKPGRESLVDASWTIKTRPRPGGRKQRQEVADIEHHRIPRAKLPQVMPHLTSGNGTLRAMLDQRSSTL
jgi:carbon storage regulator